MRLTIDYNYQLTPQSTLDIVDLGNCAICAKSVIKGYEFIFLTHTKMGKTYIAECGPLVVDKEGTFVNGYGSFLIIMEYGEKKISKMLDGFINDKGKAITTAEEITKEEAVKRFLELKDYLTNLISDGGEEDDKNSTKE